MGTSFFIFKRPKGDIFWVLASILFLAFSIYIFIKMLQVDHFNPVALVLPIVFASLGLTLIRIYFVRCQYYNLDKNKTLLLDKKNRQIQIEDNGNLSTISSSDIKDIEIFDSWITNPLFATLGYIKFNLQNGDSLIITRFTASKSDLDFLLTGHKIKTTIRLLNPLY